MIGLFVSVTVVAFGVGLLGYVLGLAHGAHHRNKLIRCIRAQEQAIEARDADMMVLLDERNRYKGAFEAIAPVPGETHITRIIRDRDPGREALRMLVKNVGRN